MLCVFRQSAKCHSWQVAVVFLIEDHRNVVSEDTGGFFADAPLQMPFGSINQKS